MRFAVVLSRTRQINAAGACSWIGAKWPTLSSPLGWSAKLRPLYRAWRRLNAGSVTAGGEQVNEMPGDEREKVRYGVIG